jgi:hypothetical protein
MKFDDYQLNKCMKKMKELNISPGCPSPLFLTNHPKSLSPISILGRLTPTNEFDRSPVGEIFNVEDQVFYEKFKGIHSPSKSPAPSTEELVRTSMKKASVSSRRNYQTLPTIRGNKELKKNALSKRRIEIKLDDFVASTQELHKQSVEENAKLSYFISKERLVARNYWENVKRTSDKVFEMSEYLGKLPIRIFREQQSKAEDDLDEQRQIIRLHNYKNLDYYKKKSKGIKKFLVKFKNKIIP